MTGVLFGMEQGAKTSDDYYTPAWVFEKMGIEFDLDVATCPSGLPWIPAKSFYTIADDGLAQLWTGRVWMNPPYSKVTPWVDKFITHGNGVCFVPFARSLHLNRLWDTADGLVVPANIGSFTFANAAKMPYPVYLAAFGDVCVEAISRLGVVRRATL